MRKMLWVLFCFLSATMTYGQSTQAAFDAFRNSIMDRQFVLRNFSGGTKVQVALKGTQFELDAPSWRTFGLLKVRSVSEKDEQIILECDRHVLAFIGLNKLAPYSVIDSVQILIDLRGGDPNQLLPQLQNAIFYSSVDDALAAIPKPLQKMVPAREYKGIQNPKDITKPCDCSVDDPCASVKGAPGYVVPKAVRTPDPDYSDEGRSRKLNGMIRIAFIVDDKGDPIDVWITRPLGYGMDEQAAKTLSNYVFKPATCHGSPVSMPLYIEMTFQIS